MQRILQGLFSVIIVIGLVLPAQIPFSSAETPSPTVQQEPQKSPGPTASPSPASSPSSSPSNTKCSLPNAEAQQSDGVCKITSCYSGWIDKDGKPENGCETGVGVVASPTPLPACSKDQPWNCKTEIECKNIGGYLCDGKCSSQPCPICSKDQFFACKTETDCKGIGAFWNQGYCASTPPTCSAKEPWSCFDESSCKGAGANWCAYEPGKGISFCQTSQPCPGQSCNSKELWNCKTELECKNIGLNWCKYSWGAECQNYGCPTAIPTPITCLAIDIKQITCQPDEESVPTFDKSGCLTGYYCKVRGICTTEWKPVCGEDWITYSNVCKAKAEGVGIRYEGECGTKTSCDSKVIDERIRKCRVEIGVPEKFTRPDGCTDIFCRYTDGVKPPINPPSDCTKEKDPVTGFVRYTCTAIGAPSTCPKMKEEDRVYAKDKCYAYGGTPDYKKTVEGCEYLDCNFEKKAGVFETSECLAEEQVKEVENKCISLGLKTVYKVVTSGNKSCKVARCIQPVTEGCPTTLPPESNIVCPRGAMETVGIDERGCNIMKCVTKEEKECPGPPPKEAFLKCEGKGGRMIVKQDERGCARFAESVGGKDEEI